MSSMNKNKYECYKGFTLAEVLLAMLITSILVLGINAAYRRAYIIWSNAEDRRPIYHTTRLITETLRQELAGLYFPPKADEDEAAGKSFSLLYLPDQGTELTFFTLTPSWKSAIESSRMAKVSYKIIKERNSDNIRIERLEQQCGAEKIISEASTDSFTTNISDFRVWAIDPNSELSDDSWIESYESEDAPPKALKVSLKWAETEKVPENEFTQSILISSSSSLL